MLTPTAEQIRTLAPDASAARAGEALADTRRWSGLGRSDVAAWGLCQGSGSSPYQVVVDVSGPAYRCSCPSRKVPCKHSLGLLFLLADGLVGDGTPPEGATSWLEARASRAAAAAVRAERPTEVDDAARARRTETRERKVRAGIDELDRWLADLMRRGLDGARNEGYRFWDAMGARLVDAQAGGLGRSVRALGAAAGAGDAWPHLLLEGTCRLHLLCQAYLRADDLPEPLRADVRAHVGWTIKEDDLEPSDAVDDRWLVVGRRVDDTGQVITARTFLLGQATGRLALHLAFGVDTAPPTAIAMPGQAFRATLAFYPSATPLRAAVRPMLVPDIDFTELDAGEGIDGVVSRHAERLARNPFVGRWPVVLRDVVPVLRGERLLVRDEGGAALAVSPPSVAPRLLAVSGGRPVTLVGEWDGSRLWPLSAFAESRLVALDTLAEERLARLDGDAEWSALVSAALLGTERLGDAMPTTRVPLPASTMDGRPDRERALLSAAAVVAVRRRAGRRAETDDAPLPAPAPEDTRRTLNGSAARLTALVVAERRSLLPELLALIRASGRRLPDETLPDLLTVAAADGAVRDAVTDLCGPRAAWLATTVPSLRAGVDTPLVDPDDAWESVTGARQRATLVRRMRAADPAAARETLARRWPDLAGDERAAVAEALEVGLSADDEQLLEQFLADRRLDVPRAAAGLLARLDGSRVSRLVEARARPLLANQGRLRAGLAVDLPTLDAELEASGFGGKPPVGLGERAWLLRQLVAHVRPVRWSQWLGAPAATLVARGARVGEARPLLEGWLEAAARFEDPEWMAVLLAFSALPADVRLDGRRALSALPDERRAAVLASIAGSLELDALAEVAPLCPPPWPRPLAEAVLRALVEAGDDDYPGQEFYELARSASIGLPVERADELVTVASSDGQVRPALAGAVETIRLRARIHAAFAELRPVDSEEPR